MNVDPRPLDYISLCAGGGGLDLGLGLALPGSRAVAVVEREAFACAHLVAAMQAGLMADAPVWTDARTFDGRPWRGLVDGLIGGIPCQPFSVAGRRKGRLDERDLWGTARRIIAQARPWFCLIENVGGILSAGSDGIAGAERVLRDLSRLGFAVEAGLFTAAEVGAPHQRERLFILAVADAGRLTNDGEQPATFEARRAQVKATGQNGNGMGTPQSAQPGLIGAVANWATPRTEMARALGNPRHITPERGNGNLEDQVSAFSLPAPETSPGGESSSPSDPTSRRQLNQAFVAWLMGWPPIASTGCGFWGMAWSRWSQDMRFALSALGSPPAAPPAQLSLLA